MSLTDWFRPPRSLLTLYVAGAGAALLALTVLAVRQLGEDDLADERRRQDRLEAVADRVVALSQQYVNDATRVLSAEPAASTQGFR